MLTKLLHNYSTASNPADSDFIQHTDYDYNARGWLTKLNDPATVDLSTVFAEQLDYDQNTNGYPDTVQYNGNISSVRWQTRYNPDAGYTQEIKGYTYTYDPLNRLTQAISKAASSNGRYSEVLTYDELGNILTLKRHLASTGSIRNNITYNYMESGLRRPRLTSVADAGSFTESLASNYSYNAMGSLTSDSRKTISGMTYNELGLPDTVPMTGKSVYYFYDATGSKLQRLVKNGATTLENHTYVNGIEYSGNTFLFSQTTEGRAVAPTTGSTVYKFEYFLKDHLGNIRATFCDLNGGHSLTSNEIQQTTDYFPFGRQYFNFTASGTKEQQYKYNGKEYEDDVADYDYGARFYDPMIARWNTIDPLAEMNRRFSPYNYVENNPIRNIDPDGMMSTIPGADGDNDNQVIETHLQAVGEKNATGDKPKQNKKSTGNVPSNNALVKYDVKNGPQINKLTSFWQKALSFLNGGRDYNGIHYDDDGNPIGLSFIKLEIPFYVTGPGDFLKGAQTIESITVLGKYPEYIKLSEQLGANRFSIPANIWNKMTSAEQWTANVKFLDRAVARGDKFLLSNPVRDINKVSGYLRKELDYLINKGYKLGENGTQLIKR